MNKTVTIIIGIILIAAAGGAAWYILSGKGTLGIGSTVNNGAAVATVNGEKITRSELDTAEKAIETQAGVQATSTDAKAQLQSAALDSLVAQKLVSQAAAKAGVTASSTEVDAQLAAAKAQFKDTTAYQQALASRGMTEAQLRAQISDSLVANAFLEQQLKLSSVTATDAEIQAAYDQASTTQSSLPPLSQVKSQVQQYVIQQKQQQLISAYVQQLRAQADVKILI